VALKNLAFDSSALPKEQSSANVIVEMPGNIDEAPSRTCRDDSLGIKTLDEATQMVRDLLAGRSQEIEIVSSTDKSIRKAIAGELLASLSRPNIEEREHARQLFMDHGYLDDAVQELGSSGLPNERAMAARALGLIASPRGIMCLVEALLDDDAEVRHAAEQALAQISGPVVADLGALLEEELNFEAAEVVESSPTIVAFQETPFQNLTTEERMVEKPMSEATEVRASTIRLEEEAVQKAMRELKHRLFDAEDLTRKRNELVQKAMRELEQRQLEAEDLTWQTIELEAAQRAEVHAARCAETQQALRELEEQHEKELALLRKEVDEFQQTLEVVTQQRAGVEEVRLETEAQIRRLDEEKAELRAAVEACKADAERQFSEAENRSLAEVEEARLNTEAQIRRFDEEKAELEVAVEARRAEVERLRIEAQRQLSEAENRSRAEVEQVRLETEAQIRRIDEEKAELETALEARRVEAERQFSEAENRSRAEVEQVRLKTEVQIRRFDKEKAELEATVEARRAEVERLRIEAERQLSEAENRSRAEVEQVRLNTAAQIRRFGEEKAELEATVEARMAEAEHLRIGAERQLSEAENRSRAEVEQVRLNTAAQIRRFDEERAELEAAVEARKAEVERLRIEAERQLSEAENRSRTEVEQVRIETEAQIRRFDEEKAELEPALEARRAEAERFRIEAERQLSEAESRSRAEQEQLFLQTADLERVTEEVAHRRAEVEASLHKANEEDGRLLEMQQATQQMRLEAEAQMRRFGEEKAELAAAVKARQAEGERLRIEWERQLGEAENRTRAEQEQLLLQTADLERVTEEVAHRRAEVEASLHQANEEDQRLLEMHQATQQMRLETAALMRQFDEEKAELEAAVEARQAEAERLRIEAKRQLGEAENRSRAEQEQFLLERADLERLTEEVAHRRAEVEASLHKVLEEDLRLLEIQRATDQIRRPASAEILWLEPEICQRTDIDQSLLEETRLRAERERQLINEVHNLQFGEVEVRKQSEQAEYLSDEAQAHNRYAVEELERISFGVQGQAIQEEQMRSKVEDIPRQLVVATQATAQLADLAEEEVENLRSLKSEQEELVEERKSAAVSRVG